MSGTSLATTAPWRRWPSWLIGAIGALLVADALALMLWRGLTSFGVTFPLAVGIVLLAFAIKRQTVHTWVHAARWRQRLWRMLCVGGALWLVSLLAFFIALARAPHGAQALDAPVSAVIVLGSGTPGATPSPPLAARLAVALDLARRFPKATVAVSGGVDFRETISEGQVMGDWLRARGLAPSRIVQEEASTSTELNLLLTQPLLAARGVTLADPVAVVTSDFHTWRAARIARRQGWQNVQAVGAPMPLYVRYNAWLREYFAIASSWLLREF
jgi:uncharacterized SAM-binding protein YcdF (DUF218 family)